MFFIFHGKDEFTAHETLDRLKTRLGDPALLQLNTTELDGKTVTLSELINHAGAMPFLSPKRLVIVNGYLTHLGGTGRSKGDEETLKKLESFLKDMPATTNLVFLEPDELKKSHPILQWGLTIDKCVYAFNAPPAATLPHWIEQRVKQKGGTIQSQAAQILATNVGDDLHALDTEVEKLTLYVNNRRPITPADVALLCPYTADSEAFGITNAIGKRDARATMDQLHKQLDEGKNALAILAGIVTQFRGLLEVKSLTTAGMSPADVAKQKGWKSDYAVKMRLQEAANFSLERMVEIFNILLDTDLAIKTGEMDSTLALDILVSRLCGPPRQ